MEYKEGPVIGIQKAWVDGYCLPWPPPPEVEEVIRTTVVEGSDPYRDTFVGYEVRSKYWVVGADLDDGRSSLVWTGKRWLTRGFWTGVDHKRPNNQKGAVRFAASFFCG